MKFVTPFIILSLLISVVVSCQNANSKDQSIAEKNECYDLKLTDLKKSGIYKEVMMAFNDTFPLLKTKKEYFGVPERVNNQVDEAIFFKKDSSECMLVVLQRPSGSDFVFGTARMVRARKVNSQWKFKVSMDFSFGKDYFNLYKDNSFDNLSKLARYNVLVMGNVKSKGCEIDDKYWFEDLKR